MITQFEIGFNADDSDTKVTVGFNEDGPWLSVGDEFLYLEREEILALRDMILELIDRTPSIDVTEFAVLEEDAS